LPELAHVIEKKYRALIRLGVTINPPVVWKGRAVSRESRFSPMTTTILIMTPTFIEIPPPLSKFLPFDNTPMD
jgi:hypothetical protein